MTRTLIPGVLALLLVAPMPARGQQPPASPKAAMIPLDIEIVVSRYQGDRKISSIPYTLNVNANGAQTSLNMGTEVAVPSTLVQPAKDGQPANAIRSYNYRQIGTVITLRANSAAEGGFEVQLNVEDSSVYSPDARQQTVPMMPDVPAFRSFKTVNTLLMKDGQTRQYTVAADRVSGEILKLDVTLKVLK